MKHLLTLIVLAVIPFVIQAQIGLGITTPHPNAYFQINSTTKGVLLPRMTAVQRTAIAPSATANGLLVFDTDSSAYFFWTGTVWRMVGAGSSGNYWAAQGSNVYNLNSGNIGIGTQTPQAKLQVADGSVLFNNVNNSFSFGTTTAPPQSGAGARMMWYPQKAAFRVGLIDDGTNLISVPHYYPDTRWDRDSTGVFSFASGCNTLALGGSSVAMGFGNQARGESTVALGWGNIASGDYSFVAGANSKAVGIGSFAFGESSVASGDRSIAMGFSARADFAFSIAMGNGSSSAGFNSIAMGGMAHATMSESVAIGSQVNAIATGSVAIGPQANANNDYAVAIGYAANAQGRYSYAMGDHATTVAGSDWSLAAGKNATANGAYAVAIGKSSSAMSDGIAIGSENTASSYAIAMGYQSQALGLYATAIGKSVLAYPNNSIAIGTDVTADNTYSTSIGVGVKSPCSGCLSVGHYNDLGSMPSLAGDFSDPSVRLLQIGNGMSDYTRSNALTLLRKGFLGLGNAFPEAPLDIANTSAEKILLRNYAFEPNPSGIGFVAGSSMLIHVPTSYNVEVGNGNLNSYQSRLYIDGVFGMVGLGTRSPQALLHIGDNNLINNKLILSTDAYGQNMGFSTVSNTLRMYSANNDISIGGGAYGITSSNLYIATALGYVGIGTTTPQATLDVQGSIRIADGSQAIGKVLTSDGFGFATWANASSAYWAASGNSIYNTNIDYVGIGNSNPISPLSFSTSLGNKISLWGYDANSHYGLGIQNNLMEIYAATVADDIALGYGSSNAFHENMRIRGNGNVGIGTTTPAFILDINGRSRIRSGGSDATSAGTWLNNNANNALPAFIGMQNDNTVGFYGSVSGWSFTMNTNTGKIKIADGTQAANRILSSDASGNASWVSSAATAAATTGVFAGGGVNLSTASGNAYTNTYVDIPAGKYVILCTFLAAQGGSGGAMTAGQSQWIRISLSNSAVSYSATTDMVGSGVISGTLGYPYPYNTINGSLMVNNSSGATKRYYFWASMSNFGGQPTGFTLAGLGSNFWSENQLVAIPVN